MVSSCPIAGSMSREIRRTTVAASSNIRVTTILFPSHMACECFRYEVCVKGFIFRNRHSFINPAWPTPMSIEAATAWRTTTKGTFPEDDLSMRSDVRVELSTVSHSVHTIFIAATRPSRWSATRITKDAAPHSRHLRPLTSVDSMLDRVMTVVM